MEVASHSSCIFTSSKEWKSFFEKHFNHTLPVYNTGYPYLDSLFNNLSPDGTVVFAPTHRQKQGVSHEYDVNEMRLYCEKLGYKFLYRGHPAFDKSTIGYEETFKRASILISDYSSFGIESIVLNIPTILLGNVQWRDNKSITSECDNAAQRVYNIDEFKAAIDEYKENPKLHEIQRLEQGKRMCDYHGTASKVTVDTMEKI
jgi:CDP-glycerol glycerophosphotransferase (TagB/SpsB family)